MSGSTTKRSDPGEALTGLVLDLFRLSSRMNTSGDRLVAELGLTSARWQILGSITAAAQPQSVAWLARDIGASRQNIQRIVNDLAEYGLIEFRANPHHKRSPLVALTDKGRALFEAAMALQGPWADRLAEGLEAEDIAITHRVIRTLLARLESGRD